jgi:hypothetical protein
MDSTAATMGVALGARIKVTKTDTKNNNRPGIKNSIYSILFFDFTSHFVLCFIDLSYI